jgi:hypothetical protein
MRAVKDCREWVLSQSLYRKARKDRKEGQDFRIESRTTDRTHTADSGRVVPESSGISGAFFAPFAVNCNVWDSSEPLVTKTAWEGLPAGSCPDKLSMSGSTAAVSNLMLSNFFGNVSPLSR